MGRKLQGTAAVVLLAAAWFAWRRAEDDGARGLRAASGPEVPHAASAQPPTLVDSTAPEAGAEVGDSRAAVEPGEPEASAEPDVEVSPPGSAHLFRIEGLLRDERGQPLQGADVYLAPHLFRLNHAGRTDAEGRFTLAFEGRRPTLDCAFTLFGNGPWPGLQELHLVAGQTLVLDLAVSDRGVILREEPDQDEPVLALRDLGYARAEGAEGGSSRPPGSFLLSFTASAPPPPRLEDAPELVRDAQGRSCFVDPPPGGACTRAELAFEERRHSGSTLEELTALGYAQHERSDEVARLVRLTLANSVVRPSRGGDGAQPGATVRGVLLDGEGEPAPGVEVGWALPGRKWSRWERTDAHGAFVLEDVPTVEIELGACGGLLGRASERVTLAPGEERQWSPRLDRGQVVVGRVRRASGEALAGVRVELWSTSSVAVWSVAGASDASGRFAFPNLPSGAFELRVFGPGSPDPAGAFPARVVGPVFAGSDIGDVVLGEQDVIPHTLSVALEREDGEPFERGEVRLWQTASGHGLFALEGQAGRFRIGGLPPGAFRVEVGGPLGWRDLGLVWIEGDLDLGVERFPAAGAVLLCEAATPDEPARPVAVSLWSRHPDVFGHVLARARLGSLFQGLRAGDFVLCAEAAGAPRLELPLRVEASAARGLTLRASAAGALESDPSAVASVGLGEAAPALRARCAACHLGAGG